MPKHFFVWVFLFILYSNYKIVMSNKKKHDNKLSFNGGWSSGEASHHISKKMTQQTISDKTKYSRKNKHKNQDNE